VIFGKVFLTFGTEYWSMSVLPLGSAAHYYSKSAAIWNSFLLTSVIYTGLSNLAMVCLKPIPFIRRALPAIATLPFEIVSPLHNNVAIVTGSNTGIGFETAKALVERGYLVVMACRSKDNALVAIQAIEQSVPDAPGKAVFYGTLDLSSFKSVREFSDIIRSRFAQISLLVNNAGRNTSGRSEKDFDLLFQTNYLGHFLLTQQLLPNLLAAEKPRVINLSSVMHHFCHTNEAHDAEYWNNMARFGRSDGSSYSASKLAAILFTLELNCRYRHLGLRSIAVNPGAVNSDIWRNQPRFLRKIFRWIYISNRQGSFTTVAAAVSINLPDDVVYLQPYYQVNPQSVTWPPFEMLGVFVGYLATQPRLPKDGTNGALTARVLWETSEALLAE
jgi:NAD(P)-dependent dehydrogenase (short-subunit alcohol dehydrogenase family)